MTLHELEKLMRRLFEDESLDVVGDTGYSLSFLVSRKVRAVRTSRAAR
ncbi:hypothetical protein [Burkholderia contaminans]|nr:hypothetical protein [Burkholderia contaminans]